MDIMGKSPITSSVVDPERAVTGLHSGDAVRAKTALPVRHFDAMSV